MTRTLCVVATCAGLTLAIAGCKENSCPTPDGGNGGDADTDTDADNDVDADTDADADADADADSDADEPPRVCTIPDVDCDEGDHAEYGLCVANSEEVAVAGGTFEMGAPTGTEFPAHSVTVSDFTIDRTEITNERYQACVEAGCCDPPSYDGSYSAREPYFGNDEYDRFPVIFITWDQALEYCEGLGKRLPTEAQWEFAARGEDARPFPWGTDPPSRSRANYDNAIDGDTAAVGTYDDGATPLGLVDMAGNVWEWVADWYSASYYDDSPSTDPPGPASGVARVARGGSFGSTEAQLYSFYRANFLPTETYSNVGFRCAR
jgi:eukaryotic-like serine/threonine-protein kinase